MRKFFLLLPLLCVLFAGCRQHRDPVSEALSAQATASVEFPAAVQSILRGYKTECTQIGGTMSGSAEPMTFTADLDADGKPDYVFNPQNLQCSESASLFCPNGGCQISIALSREGYQNPTKLLGAQPVILDGPGGKSLQVQVQSFNCKGASRTDTCVSSFAWHDGKMNQQYRIQ